jgi:hypothetical protein
MIIEDILGIQIIINYVQLITFICIIFSQQ